ncbi:uncharacterized protein HaLaN_26048, partial [Haematococcus lacustris]
MAEADQLEQPVIPPADVDASSTPAADADPEARYRYDESKLIKVKGRVKRPSKPDEAERNIQIEMLKAELLNASKAQQEVEQKILDERRSKQSELEGDIPQLLVEKKECYEIVQALRAKINEVYAEYNVKYKEYIDLDRNYNSYMRYVKRQDYLERQKAREERAAAENGMDSSNPDATSSAGNNDMPVVEAYAAEVFTIEQLVGYLRKLLPSDEQKAVVEAEVKAVEVPKVPKKKKEQGKKGSEPLEVPKTVAELPGTIEKTLTADEVHGAAPAKAGTEAGLDA